MPISPPPNPDLDRFVDAYESACEGGLEAEVDLREFVPDSGHPDYEEIAVELCRVDIERSWKSGQPDRLARYQDLFPEVYAQPRHFERLAFEEYRLRRSDGEAVDPEEYSRRFGLAVDSWPRDPASGPGSTAGLTSSLAYQELSRLRPDLAQGISGNGRAFPSPGNTFLGFELLNELGRGAFGRVYLARQGDLANRLVALKLTVGGVIEPQRLARLQHTHITPIYSVHRSRNLQAVCMPFLGRITLADLIRRFPNDAVPEDTRDLLHTLTAVATERRSPALNSGPNPVAASTPPVPAGESRLTASPENRGESPQLKKLAALNYADAVCWLIAQIADGLAHAHERGVLHCDLKPANILLSDDGLPVILDFSTAQDLTRAGGCSAMLGGTLPYMSPEQIMAFQGGGVIDERSDVYSLGLVFHELLTGQLPFPIRTGALDATLAEMLLDRRNPTSRPSRHPATLSPGLQAILTHCLEFDPARRYSSARQLHEDLTRHLDHLSLRHVREPSIRERFQKWSRRHPRLTSSTLVGGVACLAIAAITAAWWGRTSQVARLESEQLQTRVLEAIPAIWVESSDSVMDAERRQEFRRRAAEVYSAYHVEEPSPWYDRPAVRLLPSAEQRRLREAIGGVMYLDAELSLREALRKPETDRTPALAEARRFHQLAQTALNGSVRSELLALQESDLKRAEGQPDQGGELAFQDPDAARESDSALDNLWRASRWILRDQPQRAEPMLFAVLREDPRDYAARFLLGNCQARQGKWSESEGSFTACIALRPEEYAAWYHRGLVRLDRRDFAAARDDFSAVLDRRPNLTAAFINRALAEHGCGETDLAIEDLTRAIDRGATETRLWLLRSQYRGRLGDSPGAQSDYEEWSRRTPNDELSWVTRGVSKIAPDPQGAVLDLKQALLLNPRSRYALQNLAHVLSERLGQNAAAVDVLSAALEVQPRDTVLLGSRGVLLARLGRAAEATSDAEAACRFGSDDGFAWLQAACVRSLLAARETNATTDHGRELVEHGVRCLARALTKRPDLAKLTDQDHDLDGLRADPRFEPLIAAAKLVLLTGESQPVPAK